MKSSSILASLLAPATWAASLQHFTDDFCNNIERTGSTTNYGSYTQCLRDISGGGSYKPTGCQMKIMLYETGDCTGASRDMTVADGECAAPASAAEIYSANGICV